MWAGKIYCGTNLLFINLFNIKNTGDLILPLLCSYNTLYEPCIGNLSDFHNW